MNLEEISLVKTRLQSGTWEGVLTYTGTDDYSPDLRISHMDVIIGSPEVIRDEANDHWVIRVPIPVETISDGIQTFMIIDNETNEKLGSFVMLAGESLQDDIRAEMDLLRAELDMLKKAFRRHCIETL